MPNPTKKAWALFCIFLSELHPDVFLFILFFLGPTTDTPPLRTFPSIVITFSYPLKIVIVKFNFAISEIYFSLDMSRILEVQFHLCVWIVSTAPSFPGQNSWSKYLFDFRGEALTTLTCWSSRRPSESYIPLFRIIFRILIIRRPIIRRFEGWLDPIHNPA